jgi:hypothetical protein
MIEEVKHGNQLLGIIIRNNYSKDGVTFFTPDDFSQQLAFMKHPKGKIIPPHVHNVVKREVHYTKEVLFIRRGRLRVDFYDNSKSYLESRILEEGDIILLSDGGHGFTILEDIEMFEVKQGPFVGEMDKTRFLPITDPEINLK